MRCGNSCRAPWSRERCSAAATRQSGWPVCSSASRKCLSDGTRRQTVWPRTVRTRCWTAAARAPRSSRYPKTRSTIGRWTFQPRWRHRRCSSRSSTCSAQQRWPARPSPTNRPSARSATSSCARATTFASVGAKRTSNLCATRSASCTGFTCTCRRTTGSLKSRPSWSRSVVNFLVYFFVGIVVKLCAITLYPRGHSEVCVVCPQRHFFIYPQKLCLHYVFR